MLKQKLIVYLALLATLGGLLVVGVPTNRVLFVGLFVFMLMMHLGGHGTHGGHGRGGHTGHGTNEDPTGNGQVAPPRKMDEVAGK